jgi:succinate-semialdehyde dehydrogenase/glutarate-semialdehyde dehydrogenase
VVMWNFPFYQVIRFAIPSLMGKHRSFKTCIKCSRMCFCNRGCFIKAGFPRGVFMNLNVESKEVKHL